jgi:hypothetical protein
LQPHEPPVESVTQTWLFDFVVQSVQPPPPLPHASSVWPGEQPPPLQQPVLQGRADEQKLPLQPPSAWHAVSVGHAVQATPLMPQAPKVVPGWQVVPSQQPP